MRTGKVAVKVCGLRTPEELDTVHGAAYVGFVCEVPGSPRSLTFPEMVRLAGKARRRYQTVAVRVDPTLEEARATLARPEIGLLQVHGRLPEGLTAAEARRVVPSLPIGPGPLPPLPPGPPGGWQWVHLDQGAVAGTGGTGRVADWDRCRELVEAHPTTRFMLAGGLTASNIGSALRQVRPLGVDVASGVELPRGHKDLARFTAFLAALAEAEGRDA